MENLNPAAGRTDDHIDTGVDDLRFERAEVSQQGPNLCWPDVDCQLEFLAQPEQRVLLGVLPLGLVLRVHLDEGPVKLLSLCLTLVCVLQEMAMNDNRIDSAALLQARRPSRT